MSHAEYKEQSYRQLNSNLHKSTIAYTVAQSCRLWVIPTHFCPLNIQSITKLSVPSPNTSKSFLSPPWAHTPPTYLSCLLPVQCQFSIVRVRLIFYIHTSYTFSPYNISFKDHHHLWQKTLTLSHYAGKVGLDVDSSTYSQTFSIIRQGPFNLGVYTSSRLSQQNTAGLSFHWVLTQSLLSAYAEECLMPLPFLRRMPTHGIRLHPQDFI